MGPDNGIRGTTMLFKTGQHEKEEWALQEEMIRAQKTEEQIRMWEDVEEKKCQQIQRVMMEGKQDTTEEEWEARLREKARQHLAGNSSCSSSNWQGGKWKETGMEEEDPVEHPKTPHTRKSKKVSKFLQVFGEETSKEKPQEDPQKLQFQKSGIKKRMAAHRPHSPKGYNPKGQWKTGSSPDEAHSMTVFLFFFNFFMYYHCLCG